MADVQRIEIPEDCIICGSQVVLFTKAKQEGLSHEAYWAIDGDKVLCEECGALGMASVDDEIAYISWDETTPHNVACAEKYESKK